MGNHTPLLPGAQSAWGRGRNAQPTGAIVDSQSVKTTDVGRGERGFDGAKKVNRYALRPGYPNAEFKIQNLDPMSKARGLYG